MSVPAVSLMNSTPPAADKPAISTVPVKTLGQDDFLKLLVTQLTTQNPMNPVKDTDFLAQMAQFSALQQSQTMQADMAQMRADGALSQANALLGRTVVLDLGQNQTTRGAVSAVQMEDGVPKLVVAGREYDVSQVRSVQMASNRTLNLKQSI